MPSLQEEQKHFIQASAIVIILHKMREARACMAAKAQSQVLPASP